MFNYLQYPNYNAWVDSLNEGDRVEIVRFSIDGALRDRIETIVTKVTFDAVFTKHEPNSGFKRAAKKTETWEYLSEKRRFDYDGGFIVPVGFWFAPPFSVSAR